MQILSQRVTAVGRRLLVGRLHRMKLLVPFIFLALFAVINGMPPIGREYNSHCRCLRLESRIIPPDSLRSIKLVPAGPHCPDKEVIAGLANGQKVCLNPESSWVKKLVNFVLEKHLKQEQRVPKK